MGKFIFTQTEIPGVVVIEPQVFGDDRGYFMETYQKDQFAEAGIDKEFVQDNQSRSTRGVLRGLHFQKNHTQGKLVRVTKGEVYDVAVDCRPHSATFGKWVGVTLSEDNKKMFYIPEGFAHGFLVLSDVAEFCYKCTDVYDPTSEGGIPYDDPTVNVQWPDCGCEHKTSAKDKLHEPFAAQKFEYFEKWCSPVAKLKAMWNGFWRYRYLLWNLVSRDFKLKYRRSVLGVVWSVLNPLLMCLVYWAVFSSLMDMRGSGIDNFAVFLMCGQLLFNFFNEATSTSMSSVLSAAPLLKKVYIPKYIFPLEKCCFAMVNCIFSFVALLLVMIFTGAPFHLTIFEALYPLVTLFFFSLGVSMFLAAATVFFRDIMHIWSVFVTALLYFSAIFYDPTQMTFSIGGFNMQQIIKLNPMYWYITGFRRTVMWGIPLDVNMFLVCGICAVVSMVVGLQVFRKTQDHFVLHI